MEKTWQLYINGHWVSAQSGQTFAVVNPATQDVIAQVPDGGPAEAHAAVEAAAGALPDWARLPGRARGQLLAHAHQLMLERGDDLARLVTQENGKPLEEARKEVAFAAGYFHWFAEEARGVWRDCPRPLASAPPVGPQTAARRRGGDYAVELPRDDGDPQDRPSPSGRVSGRAEASVGDPADGPGPGGDPA